jgi:hypothetical protein
MARMLKESLKSKTLQNEKESWFEIWINYFFSFQKLDGQESWRVEGV